jgi:phytol kinase
MPWTGDLTGAFIIGGAVLAALGVAELWARAGRAKPEWTRKLVHVGGGIACLFFPYLIRSPWVVLAMAVLLSALFALGHRARCLCSLHRVQRPTRGAEYYPVAIFLVFLLAYGRPWLYLSSVLVLAVADSCAALVGGRYGTIRYRVEESEKSLEGSVIFLVIAFLAVHLPLLLLTDLPDVTCVLAALLVAILVTGFEAIALGGADNLFVPLAVCVILPKITSVPSAEVAYQVLSLVCICVAIGLVVWRAGSFNVGGAVALVLFSYGAWSLGSEWWALPVLIGAAVFVAFRAAMMPRSTRAWGISVRPVVRAALVPVVVLVAANATGRHDFFYPPYLAAATLSLAFSAWSSVLRHRGAPPAGHAGCVGALCLAGSVATVLVPWWVQPARSSGAAVIATVLVVCTGLAALSEQILAPRPAPESDAARQVVHFALTFAGAAVVAALQWTGVVPLWLRS